MKQEIKLLFVDDNETTMDLFMSMFKQLRPRWKFKGIRNSVHALNEIETINYDAFLFDFYLEKNAQVTGADLSYSARRMNPESYIAIFTCHFDENGLFRNLKNDGIIQDVLKKPDSFEHVFNELINGMIKNGNF